MGKRANIARNRRASEALLAQAKRDELVARGMLPATASVEDAYALRVQLHREHIAQVQEDMGKNSSPWMTGAVLAGIALLVAVLAGSAVVWFVTALVVGGLAIAALTHFAAAGVERLWDRTQQPQGRHGTPASQ